MAFLMEVNRPWRKSSSWMRFFVLFRSNNFRHSMDYVERFVLLWKWDRQVEKTFCRGKWLIVTFPSDEALERSLTSGLPPVVVSLSYRYETKIGHPVQSAMVRAPLYFASFWQPRPRPASNLGYGWSRSSSEDIHKHPTIISVLENLWILHSKINHIKNWRLMDIVPKRDHPLILRPTDHHQQRKLDKRYLVLRHSTCNWLFKSINQCL
jgi:hypothetical protein